MKYDKSAMTFVKKGWGSELWIVNNDKYCGKILSFDTGKRFSLHYHKNKDEVFYVRKGKIRLGWNDITEGIEDFPHAFGQACLNLKYEDLQEGDAFHIPPYRIHVVYALEDSEVYEFSTHHEESDSYRIEKGD